VVGAGDNSFIIPASGIISFGVALDRRQLLIPLLIIGMMTTGFLTSATPVYSDGLSFAVSGSDTYQNKSYAPIPLGCQPGVQNEYPANANAGQKILITTTVTSPCASDYYVTQIIVNILLPNSSLILSTAPASPAINTVTAPTTGGPWHLVVQVLWNGPPSSGTFETFQTTITIEINRH